MNTKLVTVPASDGPAADTQQASGRDGRILRFMEAWTLAGLLVVVAVFFTVWSKTSDTFATAANLRVLVGDQAVIAIIALAALLPLTCNEWDLSIGANAGLCAVISASLMSSGMSIWLAGLIAIAIGSTVGILNALIVTRARVNAVIATLGMATILAGAINQKTGGQAVTSDIPAALTNFGSQNWLGIPRIAFVMILAALGAYYLLGYTPVGRYLYALGGSPRAAKLVGLRTKLLLGATFVVGGALCGLAGMLQVAHAGGAAPNVGDSFTLPALAAAFLSAAAVNPGRYNVGGTIVAIFFLATLNNGLNLAGAQPYVNSYVNGVALILGVALGAYLGRKRVGQVD